MKRDFVLVWLSLVFWGIGEGAFFYFQPIYLQELGAAPLLIGSVLGLGGLAMTLSHIPAGFLADRIGRRPLLWAAWLIGLVASCLMAAATSIEVFSAGLVLYSFTSFVVAPLNSYLTHARGRLSVGRALTLISFGFASGATLGPFIGGLLGSAFGLRSVYFAATLLFLISTVLIFFIHPQPLEPHDGRPPFRTLFANQHYRNFLSLSFLVFFVLYLPQPLTPNFLQNERMLPLTYIGLLGSLGSLGNALFNLILGQLSPRIGFFLAQASVLFFSLLIWRGENLFWYGVALVMLGGYSAARAHASAQIRSFVESHQMGLAYGIGEAVASLSLFLAPPLAGWLYSVRADLIYPVSVGLIGLGLFLSQRLVPSTSLEALPVQE
ncbi:MAG: MFS transporter [Anaerolineales bacterium]